MVSKNKGEWSELYAFCYLIDEEKIYAADSNLERIDNSAIPIIKINREDSDDLITYYCGDEVSVVTPDGAEFSRIPKHEFKEQAQVIYSTITTVEPDEHDTIPIPGIEDFMSKAHIKSVTAPNRAKADLWLQVHDVLTGFQPTSGWSIKSEIGAPSSIFNASKATNFQFRVEGLSDLQILLINSINTRTKIVDRFDEINQHATSIEFVKTCNDVFARNLRLIDTRFPEIIACCLSKYYFDHISGCKEVIEALEKEDPLELGEGMYEYKFKKFLSAIALSLKPSIFWDGKTEATGGYIFVSKSGDVLAFDIYNRDEFEEYLLEHTKFEKGSTSRHSFATLYQEDGETFVNMNLQVRFK